MTKRVYNLELAIDWKLFTVISEIEHFDAN